MNRHDEDDVLSILANLPAVPTDGRLCIGPNGHVGVDTIHGYLGVVGRTVMGTMVSGYCRSDIRNAFMSILDRTMLLVTRCVTKLDNPYLLCNNISIRTLETAYYEQCTRTISQSMNRVQPLLTHLLDTYRTDAETCRHLRVLLDSSCTIQALLVPILVGLV